MKSNGKTPSEMECPFEKVHPSQLLRDDLFYMKLAYNQAIDAWREEEVPVGAVIEWEGEVIAKAHNRIEGTGDPTAHAEMLALTQASHRIGDWRLNGCTLYVTKEPCPMCSGALLMSRVSRVVFAVADAKMGCLGGAADLNALPLINHHFTISKGVFEAECRELIQTFFEKKRKSQGQKFDD